MQKVIYKKQGLSNCLRPDCWKMCFHPEEMCIFHVCLCVCCVFWEEVGSCFTLWTVVWIVSGLSWIVALSVREFFVVVFVLHESDCYNRLWQSSFYFFFFFIFTKCEKILMGRGRCCHYLTNSLTLNCLNAAVKMFGHISQSEMNGSNVSRLQEYINNGILGITC